MPKIQYEEWAPKPETLAVVQHANVIIAEYAAQGYNLTLRQLYYQFVSRDLIPNRQTEYKRLGDIVSKGRRAGLIDWNAIVDRTRNLQSLGTWESPASIVSAVAEQFKYDRWRTQPTYVEVWYEKDALMGVFERVANEWRVPFFSCRGYTSDSEVWGAAQRLRAIQRGTVRGIKNAARTRDIVILHFGDHDPSGLDMTRDIRDRLALFGATVDVRRLALNMPQVEEHSPPPNPAKETDSRFAGYQAEYGDESWELDALNPTILSGLVREELGTLIERTTWEEEAAREKDARAELTVISENYSDITGDFRSSQVDAARDNLVDDEPTLEE
jgi:hypothetical protein